MLAFAAKIILYSREIKRISMQTGRMESAHRRLEQAIERLETALQGALQRRQQVGMSEARLHAELENLKAEHAALKNASETATHRLDTTIDQLRDLADETSAT